MNNMLYQFCDPPAEAIIIKGQPLAAQIFDLVLDKLAGDELIRHPKTLAAFKSDLASSSKNRDHYLPRLTPEELIGLESMPAAGQIVFDGDGRLSAVKYRLLKVLAEERQKNAALLSRGVAKKYYLMMQP